MITKGAGTKRGTSLSPLILQLYTWFMDTEKGLRLLVSVGQNQPQQAVVAVEVEVVIVIEAVYFALAATSPSHQRSKFVYLLPYLSDLSDCFEWVWMAVKGIRVNDQ